MYNTINKLSKSFNYVGNNIAIDILNTLSDEKLNIVFNNENVKNTILKIKDFTTLRKIFKIAPAFFQEIMFENIDIQNLLIQPRTSLNAKQMLESYKKIDITFRAEELAKIENFLNSIKSDKVRRQIIENKFFQMILPFFYDKQLELNFFKNIDVVQLFKNITNDEFIFKNTRTYRKRNILRLFNKVSNHLLLVENYNQIINEDYYSFLCRKKAFDRDGVQIIIDDDMFELIDIYTLNRFLDAFSNIDKEFIMNKLKENLKEKINKPNFITSDILTDINKETIKNLSHIEFYNLLTVSQLIKDDELKKKEFIEFLFHNTGDYQSFTKDEQETLKNTLLYKFISSTITFKDVEKIFYNPSASKTIFFLKFNKIDFRMTYLNSVSEDQLFKLNVKHVNQIVKLMNTENEDEISLIYVNAIKMYLIFGLERSLRILKGEYGEIQRTFFDNIGKINIKDITFKKEGNKYIPNINEDFINFMFANEKNNHFRELLSDNESVFNKNWYYLYNNFKDIKEMCHDVITMKRVNIVLKQFCAEKDINDISYDNYKLQENEILNDVCLGNKTSYSDEYVYKSALDIYEKMKLRTESSIPYVKGKCSNGYTYEMMRLNDPIAFTLGYKANCCIRTNDVAHNHLLHATLCRNGRILIMYDQNGEFAAFSPLKRNGEVLIANSIECSHKKRNPLAIEAFQSAIKDIVESSKGSEPIGLVCIGSEAYAKPDGKHYPDDISTPTIFEKKDEVYCNTDTYHKHLDIIYHGPNVILKNLKYGDPKVSYIDPRKKPIFIEFNYNNRDKTQNVLKVINAIRYSSIKNDLDKIETFKPVDSYGIRECIYGEDFFVALMEDGKILGEYLTIDSRAENEYHQAYKTLAEHKELKIKQGYYRR